MSYTYLEIIALKPAELEPIAKIEIAINVTQIAEYAIINTIAKNVSQNTSYITMNA